MDENEELLKSLPPPVVALEYYRGGDLYYFDNFQTSDRTGDPRRPSCRWAHHTGMYLPGSSVDVDADSPSSAYVCTVWLEVASRTSDAPPVQVAPACLLHLLCFDSHTDAQQGLAHMHALVGSQSSRHLAGPQNAQEPCLQVRRSMHMHVLPGRRGWRLSRRQQIHRPAGLAAQQRWSRLPDRHAWRFGCWAESS